jgi:hypothetical protein
MLAALWMGLPAIAEIITRGSGWGSASERSASEVVPRVMRATEVAYITLRIQTSVTQELVGLPAVAAVYWSSTRPASGRQIVIPETRPYTQLGRCYQIRCYCAGGLRDGGDSGRAGNSKLRLQAGRADAAGEKHSRRASREIWSEGRLIFDTIPSSARASRLASVALRKRASL